LGQQKAHQCDIMLCTAAGDHCAANHRVHGHDMQQPLALRTADLKCFSMLQIFRQWQSALQIWTAASSHVSVRSSGSVIQLTACSLLSHLNIPLLNGAQVRCHMDGVRLRATLCHALHALIHSSRCHLKHEEAAHLELCSFLAQTVAWLHTATPAEKQLDKR